uniref:Uncharacterized protein n=1 Tax=Pseudomonas phage Cygsa01 TaxID=3138529 RepID=A0AAU6W349_9VIRU
MNASKLIHAELQLVIEFNAESTQAEIRAKSLELGAPIGKTSLSNLLNRKVEQTGGWTLVAANAEEDFAGDDNKAPLTGEFIPANEAPAGNAQDAAPAADPTPAVVAAEGAINELQQFVDEANNAAAPASSDAAPAAPVAPAADAPADAPKAEEAPKAAAPKPAAPAKTGGAPRYERDASIQALMALTDYEPILKEAPTETYVTLKLKKARIQATIGVRGVTLMLFPLKGLVLQEIDPAKTGWTVKAQYAKVGVYAPELVGKALVDIEAEIAKLA